MTVNSDIATSCNQRREPAVEVYRILLMFTICLLHAVACKWGKDGNVSDRLGGVLQFSVDGFMFISGYFGLHFRPSKVIRVCALGVVSALTVSAIAKMLSYHMSAGVVVSAYRVYCEYWFLQAYVVVMFIAPIVNAWIDSCASWRQASKGAVPFFVLVFLWSFAAKIQLGGYPWPHDISFGDMSALTLLGCYVVGRVYRKYELNQILKTQWVLVAIPLLVLMAWYGLGVNNSLVCILMAIALFLLINRVPMRYGLRIVRWLGPSLFSVYLLHTNEYGFSLLSTLRSVMVSRGIPLFAVWVLVAFMLFVGGIILDLPRRMISAIVKRYVDDELSRIDMLWAKLYQ